MATASPVTLHFVRPGIIERKGVGKDLLDKTFDSMVNRANAVPLQGADLFRGAKATRDTFKEGSVSNAVPQPVQNEDTDAIPYVTPAPGFPKTYSIVNYRSAISVTQTMVEDDQQSKISFMMSGLLDSAKRHMEAFMADVINNGFASVLDSDGMYLFDTGHPNENRDTGTWDNLSTAAALDHAAYSALRLALRKRKNEQGEVMTLKPKRIWVSADNEETIKKILNSEKVDNNNQNGINPWYNEVDIRVWDYMTSTTAYFLEAEYPMEGKGTVWVDRVAPYIKPIENKGPHIAMAEILRMRHAVGFGTCRELQGNAGA